MELNALMKRQGRYAGYTQVYIRDGNTYGLVPASEKGEYDQWIEIAEGPFPLP
jgi:hypothetical protein